MMTLPSGLMSRKLRFLVIVNIAVMVFSFSRLSAAVAMRVEDYFQAGKRWKFRFMEKGGKYNEVFAHHNAEAYLDAYIEAAGLWEEKKGPLFSRPKTNEAYWVSLKDYFRDPATRKSAKIVFDKAEDRFDASAKAALLSLAIPRDSGLYLGTTPKREVIYSNLLKLASFPKHYYVAHTDYRTPSELFATLRECSSNVRGEWILGGKMLTSFHDLRERPWTDVCDVGTVEKLDTDEWAQTEEPERLREFVKLLNGCLKEKLFPKGVKFSRDNGFYYVRATRDLADREYAYQSRENQTSRYIFKGYPKKSDHTQMSYYRHSAFHGRFVRYASEWFLQITPNYHFTRDGERPSFYAPALLTGIKLLENNQAVHGQVVMWASFLSERSLSITVRDLWTLPP